MAVNKTWQKQNAEYWRTEAELYVIPIDSKLGLYRVQACKDCPYRILTITPENETK